MVELEEYKSDGDDRGFQEEGEGFSKSNVDKKKKKKRLQRSLKETEEQEVLGDSPVVEKSGKKKRKNKLLKQNSTGFDGSLESEPKSSLKGKKKRKNRLFKETVQADEDGEEKEEEECQGEYFVVEDKDGERETAMSDEAEESLGDGVDTESDDEEAVLSLQNELKEHLLKEAAKARKRGVCYLSRIPPNMDHVKLRHILSKFGDIRRIYLAPEDPASHSNRRNRKAGRSKSREFSEGWVEFANKSVAKRVANMLNGEQIGGKKRSQFYYDLWNIKYLSKFKWDDLTEEIAYKNAVREQKLALEIAAAKRERDFYLKKVDQHRAITAIDDRLKKKQKVREAPKVIRQFPQRKPVVDKAEKSEPKLSKDVLAGVFGGS